MKAIFINQNGGVSVIHPTVDALQYMTILDIAKKDVPADVPFWVVDESFIPADRSYRDAWELSIDNMGEPSGYGGTYVIPEQVTEDGVL